MKQGTQSSYYWSYWWIEAFAGFSTFGIMFVDVKDSHMNICLFHQLQSNNSGSTSKRLVKHRTDMLFYSILTIPKLQRSDRGLYTCHVSSGDNSKQQKISVIVHGEFVPLKHTY